MSIAFSRSTRSLQQDNGRLTLVALITGIVLLVIWGGWLALGRIPVYETSREWEVLRNNNGTLVVTFPSTAFARIQPGQTARITVAATDTTPQQILSAQVVAVANRVLNQLEPGTVRVAVSGALPKPGQHAEVQVVVEELSPWTVLLRAVQSITG